jgi:hypothetical protein
MCALRAQGRRRVHEQKTESGVMRRDKTDPNAPTTFHQLALAGLELEAGGRYAQDAQVTGTTPSVDYPAASGPWSDPQPPEPPTGENIDAAEPVGTPAEIEASLERIERESE